MPPVPRCLAGRLSRRAALAVRTLVAASFVAVLTFAAAAPAGAHDDVGTLTVAQAAASGNAVSYAVDVAFVNDGHPAPDATVTVVAEGPAGAAVGPLTMTETSTVGRYAATVDFPAPGGWTVRFTSLTPLGTTEATQEVAAPASGPGSPTTPVTNLPVPTTQSPTAATAAPTTAGTSSVTSGDRGGHEPDDFAGTGTRVLLIAGLVAVLGAASAIAVVRRRGRGR